MPPIRRDQLAELREIAAIVESSNDAIIGKRLDGTITSWNPAAERMYGYGAAEMIGSSIELLRAGGAGAEEIMGFLERLGAGERITPVETTRVAGKDGFRIDLSADDLGDRRGGSEVVGALTIGRKISPAAQGESSVAPLGRELPATLRAAPGADVHVGPGHAALPRGQRDDGRVGRMGRGAEFLE